MRASFIPHLKKISAIVIAVAIIIFSSNQVSLRKKYKGNFSMHLSYQPVTKKCIDFSINIDGQNIFSCDSIGVCSNIYYIDSVLTFPTGVKIVKFSSDSLNFIHEEKMINLFFIWSKIDIYEYKYKGENTGDSIIIRKELNNSYFPIKFI
ncbi:MAG: hypothetical protein IPK76_19415 [Lewinellaceae bacterium]|jgi:hypothetical protein|nr:hypothetical protein [Lewinellaceae bacterium]